MFRVNFLEELDHGSLARIAICEEQSYILRYAARDILVQKLDGFKGAMWVGASIEDRADVIRALKLDLPKAKYVEALCARPF